MGVDIAIVVLLLLVVFGSFRETKFNKKIYSCQEKICKIQENKGNKSL